MNYLDQSTETAIHIKFGSGRVLFDVENPVKKDFEASVVFSAQTYVIKASSNSHELPVQQVHKVSHSPILKEEYKSEEKQCGLSTYQRAINERRKMF